jgi:hypothetical protein
MRKVPRSGWRNRRCDPFGEARDLFDVPAGIIAQVAHIPLAIDHVEFHST